MSDDADLEGLDDDALARLAYGRADSETARMLAQRAARILASRRPAPPPADAAPRAATTSATSPAGRAGAPPTHAPVLRGGAPDVLAGAQPGGDSGPAAVGAPPLARDRAPRWMLVAATAAAVALVGAALAVGLPRTPAPFAIFDDGADRAQTVADDSGTTADAAYAELLANAGERLLSPARVIASTRLDDGGRLDLVAYRQGREGAPAERREACVALYGTLGDDGATPRRWERTCLPEADFLRDGIDATLALTGVEIRYAWPAAPTDAATGQPAAPAVTYAATGPTSVAAALGFAGDALGTLRPANDAEPPPLVASIMTAVRPAGAGPILLGPTELTRVGDEAILIGYLTPGPLPGAELSVCGVAVRLGVAWGEIDERCVPVSTFAASGLGTEQSPNAGVGTFSYRWEPTGEATLIVLRP